MMMMMMMLEMVKLKQLMWLAVINDNSSRDVPGVMAWRAAVTTAAGAAAAPQDCGESSVAMSTYGCVNPVPCFTTRVCFALIAFSRIMIPVC
jgi:hypothetical protein